MQRKSKGGGQRDSTGDRNQTIVGNCGSTQRSGSASTAKNVPTNAVAETRVYPNPSMGMVNVEMTSLKAGEEVVLRVVSMPLGRTFLISGKADGNGSFMYKIGEDIKLAPGMYLLQLTSGESNTVQQRKLIIK